MTEAKKLRAYISGFENQAARSEEATRLAALGYEVTNATESNSVGKSKPEQFRRSIQALLTSDFVVYTPGWHLNPIALLERSIAANLKLPTVPDEFVTDGNVLENLAQARQLTKERRDAAPLRPIKFRKRR